MSTLTIGYTMLLYWGPKMMASRQPFKLYRPILVYNALQVLLNAVLCIHVSAIVIPFPIIPIKQLIEKLSIFYIIII